MNDIVSKLLESMPDSPTELTKKNIKRIIEYMPVPNDYEILWADVKSFSGYPSGIVITDKGIVFKASREALKENKDKEKKHEKKLKILYQIILWEYFDPEDYPFEKQVIEGKEVYVLKNNGNVISIFENTDVYNFFVGYGKELDRLESTSYDFSDSATMGEIETLNFEQTTFNAAYGSDQSQTGHGIYAEEGSTILDKLNGEQSTVVGDRKSVV